MRKSILFLSIIALLYSCNSDDNNPEPEAQISGNWKLTEWYDTEARDINGDGNASTDLLSQWNGCWKQSSVFLYGDFTSAKVYLGESDNQYCFPNIKREIPYPYLPYRITGNNETLTFIGDDFNDSYPIIELTNETLVLKGSGFLTCCDESIGYFTGGYLKFERVIQIL